MSLLAPVLHGSQHLLEPRLIPNARQMRIPAQPTFPVVSGTGRAVEPIERVVGVAHQRIELRPPERPQVRGSCIRLNLRIHFADRFGGLALQGQQ
jgi:hypothetical protein